METQTVIFMIYGDKQIILNQNDIINSVRQQTQKFNDKWSKLEIDQQTTTGSVMIGNEKHRFNVQCHALVAYSISNNLSIGDEIFSASLLNNVCSGDHLKVIACNALFHDTEQTIIIEQNVPICIQIKP